MTQTEKAQVISRIAEQLQKAQSIYFADFTGITVEEVNALRRECFKAGVKYTVAKNTLISRAMEGASYYEAVKPKLTGPTAIALGYSDPIAPAKILKKFSDKTNKLSVKSFVFEGQVFDGKRFEQIASLQSKPELVAGVLGSLQSPIVNLVYILDALEKKTSTTSSINCNILFIHKFN